MVRTLVFAAVLFMGTLAWAGTHAAWFNVRDYGAKGDGAVKDTASVQKAVDACAGQGGGTVLFPAGAYLCGSLHLRGNVTLRLEAGATILGSKDGEDYDKIEKLDFKNASDAETSFFHHALIWGEDVERVAIVGEGVIDCNRDRRHGPKGIALKCCKFVDIKGVRLQNCPNYNISLLGTDFVNIDGVTILNGHADGIDPDSCRNVRISNCHIESWDDAIVPKASYSLGERRSCENITVTNCYLASACSTFKLGTESGGDFKRITVSNCVMEGLAGERPALGGVALESVDGANVDGVAVSNISMHDVSTPVFIRLGNRGRDMATPVPGSLKNVVIDNIVATDASNTCSITGIPGARVDGVSLSNIRTRFKGGCAFLPEGETVPELEAEYPDSDMFPALSAYGMFVRHVDNLVLRNVQLLFDDGFWRITTRKERDVEWPADGGAPTPSAPGNPGPALVCDDVSGLSIDMLQTRAAPEGGPVLRFVDVRNALLRGSVASEGTKTYLEVSGASTKGIHLNGNILDSAAKPVAASGVDEKEVQTS